MTVKTLHLGGGSWVPLGHKQNPPALPRLFGPPRFSQEDQATNPDKPMTRLVKDVLRVGRWKVGTDKTGEPVMWEVTPAILQELAANFHAAQKNGVAINLTLSHGNRSTGIVPTDELIAPLDDAVVEGQTLWFSTYVTPEQAKRLQNPAMKVSIGVHDDWMDGAGRVYSSIPIHVAVTDHPVVTGQGPFVALANKQDSKKRNLSMDFAALAEVLNKLLNMVQPGVALPEDTSEENVVERVNLILSVMNGGETPPESSEAPAGSEAEVSAGDLPPALSQGQDKAMANLQAAMKAAVAPLQSQIKTLANTVAELKTDKANAAKQAFEDRCKRLLANGIPAATLEKAKKLGASEGYNLAILDLVEGAAAAVPRRSLAKSLANASAAPLSTDEPTRRSDEEVAASLKARGIDPKHLPQHHPVNGRS